jgi:hypothetical protein
VSVVLFLTLEEIKLISITQFTLFSELHSFDRCNLLICLLQLNYTQKYKLFCSKKVHCCFQTFNFLKQTSIFLCELVCCHFKYISNAFIWHFSFIVLMSQNFESIIMNEHWSRVNVYQFVHLKFNTILLTVSATKWKCKMTVGYWKQCSFSQFDHFNKLDGFGFQTFSAFLTKYLIVLIQFIKRFQFHCIILFSHTLSNSHIAAFHCNIWFVDSLIRNDSSNKK